MKNNLQVDAEYVNESVDIWQYIVVVFSMIAEKNNLNASQ